MLALAGHVASSEMVPSACAVVSGGVKGVRPKLAGLPAVVHLVMSLLMVVYRLIEPGVKPEPLI